MTLSSSDPLPDVGAALAAAVTGLRRELGDASAPLVVLTPSRVNGLLARREFALQTPFIRVAFQTPEALQTELAAPRLRRQGLRPEPPLWLRATLGRLLRSADLGPYGETLREAGWLSALVHAIGGLEAAGVTADALRRAGTRSAPHLRPRAELLAALLDALAEARTREGLWSPADVAAAALQAIASGEAGATSYAGAVVLGDSRLSASSFRTLEAYLRGRPVVRVEQPPLSALEPASRGLTRAAPHARVVRVAEPEPTVVLARTPDPVREVTEAVREVQDAILAGTPLDRIAVVLPDVTEAVSLREALERAGIVATWQVGPPLSDTPAARFLLHALDVAAGDDSVPSWYELLRTPGLALRRNLGPGATRGRGRWRRLLARCGAQRGTDAILAALDAYEGELAEQTPDDDHRAADAESFASLRTCMRALADAAGWRDEAPMGVWAGRFAGLLRAWLPASPDQHKLTQLLGEWARGGGGPRLHLAEARDALRDTLESTDYLRGSLKDASIRVLSPMQTLGGHFEHVCVLGMTQGRFPADPSPDPIVDDALVEALDAVVDAGLLRSSERVAIERRRFAAVRASARGRLWLSCPRLDLAGGRPLLPGALLLELASEDAGHRVTFRELEEKMVAQGRRSRPFSDDPARALGATEHLIARLHAQQDDALAALADHPWARRLMTMHRAFDRLRAGEEDPALRRFATVVDPARVPCPGLDGAPLDASQLALLASNPAEFFFRYVLGAWPPVRLQESWAPDPRRYVLSVLHAAAQEALESEGALDAAAEARLREAARRAGVDEDALQPLLELTAHAAGALAGQGPANGRRLSLEAASIDGTLPWRISGLGPRMVGTQAEWLLPTRGSEREVQQKLATMLEAAALMTAGREVAEARLVWADGTVKAPKSVTAEMSDALTKLARATQEVADGLYRGAPPKALALEQEGPTGLLGAAGADGSDA